MEGRGLGVVPQRRMNSRGRPAPHLSLSFDSHLFSIDTSRCPKGGVQPDAYLITHAHSDHHGRSAMLSESAVASKETARALEIRYGRKYMGRTFAVGKSILIGEVEVRTYPTGHTIGSAAFAWESEAGTRVLVTGDVKDYSALPRSDLLVTEANYGDPWDPSCTFDDDLTGFYDALEAGASFGAYAFGKAQRAVALIRAMGLQGEIGMDDAVLSLTRELMPDAGPFADFREAETCVVAPGSLAQVPAKRKYFLTGRSDLPYPTIRLSDHLDFRGLMRMIERVSPEEVLVYHPGGERASLLANYLKQCGLAAASLDQIKI